MLLLPIQRMAAQSALRMQNYSHELSEHMVTDIRQDERGFLWFSTWNGLHRFDGYTFKNYKTYPGEECVMEHFCNWASGKGSPHLSMAQPPMSTSV